MGFARHGRMLAGALVVVLAVVALVGFAVRSPGVAVRSIDLNDAGVWVTNNKDSLFGRLNRAAGALDSGFYAPGGARAGDTSRLDVRQEAGTVIAIDRTISTVYPVDVRAGLPLIDQGAVIAQDAVIDMRGGTVAALDIKTGRIWATRYRDGEASPTVPVLRDLASASEPIASLTALSGASSDRAALAVAMDGTIYAADVTGRTVTITPAEGGFAEPRIGTSVTRSSVAVSAVGRHRILAEPDSGAVQVDDAAPVVQRAAAGLVLQEPSSEGTAVIVATPLALWQLPLDGSAAKALFAAGTGRPARPVIVSGCALGAWGGDRGTAARSCGGRQAVETPVSRNAPLRQPVFRVNRDQVVVNDLTNGALVDVERKTASDDWAGIVRPLKADKDAKGPKKTGASSSSQAPTVTRGEFGARPGRTTVLHVLDNVQDIAGHIRAITSVEHVTGGRAQISPDLQTVSFTLDPKAKRAGFDFVVDAGGPSRTGHVDVTPKPSGNAAPLRREQAADPIWTVPAAGVISVPVLGQWRDGEGDALALFDASVSDGVVRTTGEGNLELAAPATGGVVDITYRVTDGRSKSQPAHVRVDVQDPQATQRKSAVTRPDVVAAEPGSPVTFRPTVNDLPGSDPTDPSATISLDGDVTFTRSAKRPLNVTTDPATGTVTVTAAKEGSYTLGYRAAYGSADPAPGQVRLEVRPAKRAGAPVAMPDTASVRGLAPALVDVIGNDIDPAGRVLTVQSATVEPKDAMTAATVGGRWLRLMPTGVKASAPPVVSYEVSNGEETATGQVSVALLAPLESDQVVVRADAAVVRAGDSTLIPALENDSTLSGGPLTLKANVPGAPGPGQLLVTDPVDPTSKDVGAAYVSGSAIRFLAPAKVASPRTLAIDYVAVTDTGESGSGRVMVIVQPLPSQAQANAIPTPEPLEARTVQGDTVTIPVATSGHDPDGDSSVVTGIASAPRLGRIMGFGPNSIVYQAYPQSRGTDVFTYSVSDAFGAMATASVRVAVVPAGDPQLAVPLPDTMTVAPGAHVTINPLANDLFAKGDPVTIVPLAQNNPKLPAGVALQSPQGPVTATAPPIGKSLTVTYGLTGNAGPSSLSTVTIRSAEDAQLPPRITDHVAKATSVDSATVDVLTGASDPDGDSAKLQVTSVASSNARIAGAKVVISVTDVPQAIPYVVTDEAGSSAAAVIYVPAAGSGGPFAIPGKAIALPEGGSADIRLGDYIDSPTGSRVVLADGRYPVLTSPAKALRPRVTKPGATSVTVAAEKGFSGPAALLFSVTDVPKGAADAAPPTLVSIPVQVGDDQPLLRCPPSAFDLVAGAEPMTLDVASLCHVWTSDPAAAAGLTYDAAWVDAAAGIDLAGSGSNRISLSARADAKAGVAGKFSIAVSGATGPGAVMSVRVTKELPPPTISPIRLDHVKAGESVSVDLAEAMTSPLPAPTFAALSVSQAPGAKVSASVQGSRITLTPAANATGVLTVGVTATDSAGSRDRIVTGSITLSIFAKPDPPSRVVAQISTLAASAEVSWQAGAANGSPIDYFEVSGVGSPKRCAASPCAITGLPVGDEVSFTVRAHNEAGFSDPSPASAPVTIDEVPKPPTGLRVTPGGDGELNLSWTAAQTTGSRLTGYDLSVQPGVTGAGQQLGPGATSTTVRGLTNGQKYTFTLAARNAVGSSVPVTASGTPVGPPSAPVLAEPSVRDNGDGINGVVDLSWSASSANAPGAVSYTLSMNGSPISSCSGISATSCSSPPVTYGASVSFRVEAKNSAGMTASSDSVSVTPEGQPSPWSSVPTSKATGSSGEVTISFTTPPTNSGVNTLTAFFLGQRLAISSYGPSAQSDTVTLNVGVNVPVTVKLQLCNAKGLCSTSDGIIVEPYGAPDTPVVSVRAEGTVIYWSVSLPGGGMGRPATMSVSSSDPNFGGPSSLKVPATGDYASGEYSFDTGQYDTTVDVTATVAAEGGTSSSTGSAITGSKPADATIDLQRGTESTDPAVCGVEGTCYQVVIVAENFDSGGATCTVDVLGQVAVGNGANTFGYVLAAPTLSASCSDGVESASDTEPWGL